MDKLYKIFENHSISNEAADEIVEFIENYSKKEYFRGYEKANDIWNLIDQGKKI